MEYQFKVISQNQGVQTTISKQFSNLMQETYSLIFYIDLFNLNTKRDSDFPPNR